MRDKAVLVTGGAGFIGSHLVDRLLAQGARVTVYDNFSTGRRAFLEANAANPRLRIVQSDVLDRASLRSAVLGMDVVVHTSADPEVRITGDKTELHLEQNVTATHRVLEAMREAGVRRLVFTSTSTVYGEAAVLPTPESYGPCAPISLYGASKLASESLISAYCHTFDLSGVVLRFANVVGPRSTHGVTYDFVHKLRANPARLEILGDGKQTKSYVHVDDVVAGLLHAESKTRDAKYEVFNIGSDDAIDVRTIADVVAEVLGLRGVDYAFTGGVEGGRGWKGDVKIMRLANDKLKKLGWKPRFGSADAIRATAKALA